ncbi:uncharacterized protein LOC132064028 [Lycium ferocissimum]|uniref:uncharacterized protein LOC132064028 n=1 Tax=Lycium ferocissimum TaxID=112874 RepID=UPI002815D9DF|nr:uncharacterized protein LOC132064028 [Lycium ferocissimum]
MRHRELEFSIGDKVFLKLSLMKGVMEFGKKGKVSPCFIGPYEIVRKIGMVAYELKLLSDMAMVHLVFHISMLRLHKPDPSYVLNHEEIDINEVLSYDKKPVQILDRQVRRLRTKDIASVKMLWWNHDTEEETWGVEGDMKKRYPHLFLMAGYLLSFEDE